MEFVPSGSLRDYLRQHRTHGDQSDRVPTKGDDVMLLYNDIK